MRGLNFRDLIVGDTYAELAHTLISSRNIEI